MRHALLAATVAVAMLAGCRQSADSPAANAVASKTAQVLPQTDVDAATDVRGMQSMDAMKASMKGKPMPHDAAMQRMHERHEGMERIGKTFKATGRTLKSGSPDLALVLSSAATIAQLSVKTMSWFPAGTGPDIGKTGAKPDIWQKPDDFVVRDKAFQQAAAVFNAAAKSGDMTAIQARFGDLGKTCKACHDSYRNQMHH